MERRKFIRLVGGGIILAAGTTVLARFITAFDVPPSATAAWNRPSSDSDIRYWALSYAILAPNPHNLQPWLVDLRVPGIITLLLDEQRLLPATDPYGRQILMGAGAFIELLTMAAAERGHRVELALFPEGEPSEKLDAKPFARVRLVPDASVPRDPLFAQVLKRRTDRRAYDATRAIAPADLAQMSSSVADLRITFGVAGRADAPSVDRTLVEAIRAIAKESWRIELTTEATMMESMRLLRFGGDEIDQHRDGIAITQPMLVTLAKLGFIDRNKFPAPDSQEIVGQIKDFNAITDMTPAYMWIVTEGNARSQQILAGRAYVRVNLAGTAQGLAMHPNQQALQEYPQVARQYHDIHTLLGTPSPRYTLQMLARVGYLPSRTATASPAPRRGLNAHLVT
ncbi:MAG: twin-arginine translocation pathway signal protein [Pseudanabaena sp. M57BS1SP1A06MG]|nr:twin-arginine translocation pathway signal protein [Pseudanabaena sp. M53BS1SP1A06MG]MCA6584079.1 twin-arginine translocation pathway signal protein [Pseudanabaena sp. M34BS1SP1A06MG]MCA6592325.1 twin-arginine translocation pathway signal protein [Pseudanabaena sp. M38BS1SP1A06MG]MCA6602701.1 twin-arginine translocation pathway signal protein [Pseudanabaena sp. M57BS1SP1A06MG]